MLTRRRFLGYSALAPAVMAYHPLLGSAIELTDPAPKISPKTLAIHKHALVFDGHVHALDREFYQGGSMGTRKPKLQPASNPMRQSSAINWPMLSMPLPR